MDVAIARYYNMTNNCIVSGIVVMTLIDLMLSNTRVQVGVHF